jgi:hypothetical protein
MKGLYGTYGRMYRAHVIHRDTLLDFILDTHWIKLPYTFKDHQDMTMTKDPKR